MYMLSYISKPEHEMNDFLKTVIKGIRETNIKEEDEMKHKMQAYSKHWQVSAQESVARTCSLPMKKCSRSVVFIPTDDDALKMSLPLSALHNKDPDSEDVWMSAWRIPIYSAYVLKSPNIGRCDAWFIEPQLDNTNAVPCMRAEGPQNTNGNKQAVNSDYEKSNYGKGHLYPVQHTNNHLSMLATSTLTNAAPQDLTFNRGQWSKHEKDVILDLQSCNESYVVTGVVPDTNIRIPTNNPRVTVSKYYWRATCCKQGSTFIGKGYFGPDNNGKVQSLSITDLQQKLIKDYHVTGIIIFPVSPPGHKRPLTDVYTCSEGFSPQKAPERCSEDEGSDTADREQAKKSSSPKKKKRKIHYRFSPQKAPERCSEDEGSDTAGREQAKKSSPKKRKRVAELFSPQKATERCREDQGSNTAGREQAKNRSSPKKRKRVAELFSPQKAPERCREDEGLDTAGREQAKNRSSPKKRKRVAELFSPQKASERCSEDEGSDTADREQAKKSSSPKKKREGKRATGKAKEKQRKQEKQRKKDMERLAELRREIEEQVQRDKERVKFRKEQFQLKLQMREDKEKQKQRDDKEKEERLQALRNQVSKVAEANPERMMGNTVAWGILSDPRVRIEQALRTAGLHNTPYARQILSEIQPLKPPRRDMESAAFRS
ncbi:endonuclease domain-containing 1 -like protein [Labeo rohita]|uniref:Endonuclease domain-containing 1-like protein n=1 Tax=Labeo rohita TaxID=84645 RepID=A0A498LP58_LABRO|nr:endonuclease domain-containing 1 -like protein [Labeo rohita]